jgi:hypothetical protein
VFSRAAGAAAVVSALAAATVLVVVGALGVTSLRAPALGPRGDTLALPSPPPRDRSGGPYAPPVSMPVPSRTRVSAPPPPPDLPPGCAGNWQYDPSNGPLLGTGGPLLQFHVAVEYGLPIQLGDFSAMVDRTLGDGRSWVGSGTVELQRASAYAGADFTIYLACPWTAYNLCASGGVDIRVNGYPYTDCRVGNLVVINSDRYIHNADAVIAAGGDLTNYRYYLINHEVGHRLGYNHVHCPSPGQLAPVMQQQTLRMEGCIPNGWPYPYNSPGTPPTPAPTPAATNAFPAPTRTRGAVPGGFAQLAEMAESIEQAVELAIGPSTAVAE